MLINFKYKNKWGYYNSTTKEIIEAQFLNCFDFVDGYAIVQHYKNNCYGVINECGNEVLPFIFSQISYQGKNIFNVSHYHSYHCLYNQYGKIVDENGVEMQSFLQSYKIVQHLGNDFYLVITNDDEKYILHEDKVIISFKDYGEVKDIRSGLIIMYSYGNYHVYDYMGKEIPFDYSNYNFVCDNYIIVYAGYNKGYGILDTNLNVILPPIYSKIEYKIEDLFCLSYNNDRKEELKVEFDASIKCFCTKNNGKTFYIPFSSEIDWCKALCDHIILFSHQNKYGLIDSDLNIKVKCQYDEMFICKNQKNIIGKKDNLYYLINIDSFACSDGFEILEYISDNYFKFKEADFGIINSNLEVVLPANYNKTLSYLENGYFCVSYGETKNIINSQGHIVLDNGVKLSKDIISINKFSNGLAKVTNIKKLQGFVDEQGIIVIPCKFDGNVSDFDDNVANVSIFVHNKKSFKSRKYTSIINREGNFVVKHNNNIIELNYDYQLILNYIGDVACAYLEGRWFLISMNGKTITSSTYEEIFYLRDNFYLVRVGDCYGIINANGNEILKCKYPKINFLDNNLFQVVLNSDEITLFNTDGNIIVHCNSKKVFLQPLFDYVSDFVDNYALVKKEGKYGIIDIEGSLIIECIYDSMSIPEIGHSIVTLNKTKYLLSISDNYKLLLPDCNIVRYYNDNFIVVGKTYPNTDSNFFYVIDKYGNVLSNHYNDIGNLKDDIAIIKVRSYPHSLYGLLSSDCKEVVKPKYYSLKKIDDSKTYYVDFEEVYEMRRKIPTNPHYIDCLGNTVILNGNNSIILPSKYVRGRNYSCSLAAVAEERKIKETQLEIIGDIFDDFSFRDKKVDVTKVSYGFIDINGKECIHCQYDYVTDFLYNMSICTINSKKCVIDINGEVIIPAKYDDLDFLSTNFFKAKFNGLWGVISILDEIIIPFLYIQIGNISDNIISVKVKTESINSLNNYAHNRQRIFNCYNDNQDSEDVIGKWGFINIKNETIIPCQYSEVHDFNNGIAALKDNHWTFVNDKGDILFTLPETIIEVSDFINGKAIITFEYNGNKTEHYLLDNGHILVDDFELSLQIDSFLYIDHFYEGLAKFYDGKYWNFINSLGEIVISGLENEPTNFSNGLASYKSYEYNNYNPQYINKQGVLLLIKDKEQISFPKDYCAVKEIFDGFFDIVRKSDKLHGIIDENLNCIIPFTGRTISIFESEKSDNSNNHISNICFKVHMPIYESSIYATYYNSKGQRVIPDAENLLIIPHHYSYTSNNMSCGLGAVSNNENLWGFVNRDGKEVIPCIFDSVDDFFNGFCVVRKDSKIGLINTFGDFVIKLNSFSEITDAGDGTWDVRHDFYGHDSSYVTSEYDWDSGDCYDVIEHEWIPDIRKFNNKGEILIALYGDNIAIPTDYEWTDSSFHEGFISVCKDDKWGVLNTRLEQIVPCLYDEKVVFHHGIAIAHKGKITEVIDTFGNIFVSGLYKDIEQYEELNIMVCSTNISDRLDIFDFSGHLLFCSSDVKSKIYLKKDQTMSSSTFSPSKIIPLDKNYLKFYVCALNERFWGICNLDGKVLTDARFDDVKSVGGGLLGVAKSTDNYYPRKLWGYADMHGNIIVDYKYLNVKPFILGLGQVQNMNDKWGLISSNGKELTNCVYDNIEIQNDEFVVSNSYDSEKKNYITENGLIHHSYYVETNARGPGDGYDVDVFLSGYDWCSKDYYGLCIVQKGNKYGIISEDGTVLFPLSEMGDVVIVANEGSISFKKKYENEYKSITKNGKIITECNNNIIELPSGIHWCKQWTDGFIEIESNGKWGLLDLSLQIVIEPKYDFVQYIGENHVLCKLNSDNNKKYCIVDLNNGNEFVLPYDSCSVFENKVAIVSKVINEYKSNWSNEITREFAYGLIDYTGKEILPCTFDKVQFRIPPRVEKLNDDYGYNDDYDWREGLLDAFEGDPDAMWGRLD